jgi:hypothetical protein
MNGKKIVGVALAGCVVGGVLALGVSRALASGIPTTNALTYTGFLEDSGGVAVNGSRAIEVKLWDTASGGTTPLCITNPVTLNVAAGRFSVPLPDTCTTAAKANKDMWVEVLVAAASLGRTKVGAVPYAVEADEAQTAVSATTASTANAAGGALKTQVDSAAGRLTTLEQLPPNLRQIVVGAPVAGQTASAGPAMGAFSPDIAVTFTAQRTRKFRVSLTAPTYINRTDASANLRIVATTASPSILFSQEAYLYNSPTSNSTHSSTVFVIATLTAGTSYTFRAEGSESVAGGSVMVFADRLGSGVALVAEEIE